MFAAAGGPVLDREAFIGVAKKFGLEESCVDDFGGKIDTNDFLKSLRVPFPERSQALMDKIWKILDIADLAHTDGSEIKQRYDSRKFNGGCDYVGRYTDPNHEGGFRDITLLDEMDGDKRLALCVGTGGRGEPEHFELPSWINPDGSIVIDFSAPPKGGPKDFVGRWDRDGIRFIKDGNKWPKVPKTRDVNLANFFNMFTGVDDFLEEVMRDQFYELHQDIYLSCGQEEVFLVFME